MSWETNLNGVTLRDAPDCGGAGEKIVQSDDRVAFRQQAIAHVRADESGGSGNDNAQCSSVSFILTKPGRASHATFKRTVYVRPILAGKCDSWRISPLFGSLFWFRFRKVLDVIRARAPRRISSCAAGAAHPAIPVGSDAARQGDPTAPAARTGARLRVLGISVRSR